MALAHACTATLGVYYRSAPASAAGTSRGICILALALALHLQVNHGAGLGAFATLQLVPNDPAKGQVTSGSWLKDFELKLNAY